MPKLDKTQLDDLTEDVPLTFHLPEGSQSRLFRLREQSRSELDHWYDLHEKADLELHERAKGLAEPGLSTIEAVKRVANLHWEHLAPLIVQILRDPLDGLPVPTLKEIRLGLNGRKVLNLIVKQEELDGTDELKKRLDRLNGAMVSVASPTAKSAEPGSPLTTE